MFFIFCQVRDTVPKYPSVQRRKSARLAYFFGRSGGKEKGMYKKTIKKDKRGRIIYKYIYKFLLRQENDNKKNYIAGFTFFWRK